MSENLPEKELTPVQMKALVASGRAVTMLDGTAGEAYLVDDLWAYHERIPHTQATNEPEVCLLYGRPR